MYFVFSDSLRLFVKLYNRLSAQVTLDCCERISYRRMAEVDKWSRIVELDDLEIPDEAFMLSKGMWAIKDGTEDLRDNRTATQEAELRIRPQKAFSTIVMSMCSSHLYLITSCEEL